MPFDYSTLPNNFESSLPTFSHSYQFYEGDYSFANTINQIDANNFSQTYLVRNGGDDWVTNVKIDVFYDGKTYKASFTDLTSDDL